MTEEEQALQNVADMCVSWVFPPCGVYIAKGPSHVMHEGRLVYDSIIQ